LEKLSQYGKPAKKVQGPAPVAKGKKSDNKNSEATNEPVSQAQAA
jgi:hypothetical protein